MKRRAQGCSLAPLPLQGSGKAAWRGLSVNCLRLVYSFWSKNSIQTFTATSWSPETTGDEKYTLSASYFSRHLVGNTREINREMYADRFKPECTHLGFDRWQKS